MLNLASHVPVIDRDDDATTNDVGPLRIVASRTSPTLSIVMPVHGGSDWLPATLTSLAAEMDDRSEVILIDSSADNRSLNIASSFTDRLGLTILHRPDLVSWIGKTNLGVALAKGRHIAMLHQDDLWLPGRMAALRRWIASAPEVAVHFAPTRIVDTKGHRVGDWRCPLSAGVVDQENLLDRLIVQCFVSVPAPIFRRDAFLAVGGMDLDLWYTADWDLWLKLARSGAAMYHDEVTTAFRIHAGSLTMKGSRDEADFAMQLRTVLTRHRLADTSRRAFAMAEASLRVNIALAAVANGRIGGVIDALAAVARLGPIGAWNYIYQSRILDRALPRVRAKLAGAF